MNDTIRLPSSSGEVHPAPLFPTAVASACLASVLWLLLASFIFSLLAQQRYREQARQQAYYGKQEASVPVEALITVSVLVVSILASLGLIVVSFCLWPRHILTGKVLTVTSAVLFLPFLCCGGMLGVM